MAAVRLLAGICCSGCVQCQVCSVWWACQPTFGLSCCAEHRSSEGIKISKRTLGLLVRALRYPFHIGKVPYVRHGSEASFSSSTRIRAAMVIAVILAMVAAGSVDHVAATLFRAFYGRRSACGLA